MNPTVSSSQSQCNSKSWCPRIFINHKCFTGPALSKSKICELPQYVGPGPITLVLQEVISKIIQVAYVPNRVLNELSSQAFQDLLKKRDIKKTDEIMFKVLNTFISIYLLKTLIIVTILGQIPKAHISWRCLSGHKCRSSRRILSLRLRSSQVLL